MYNYFLAQNVQFLIQKRYNNFKMSFSIRNSFFIRQLHALSIFGCRLKLCQTTIQISPTKVSIHTQFIYSNRDVYRVGTGCSVVYTGK
jgi:hypothetical protein